MDNVENIEALKTSTIGNPKSKYSLSTSYQLDVIDDISIAFSIEEGIITRNSKVEYDFPIVNYLCTFGLLLIVL